jgi:hypothetical protein
MKKDFSQSIRFFYDQVLPEPDLLLAGYAALIHVYQLTVPLPYRLSAIGHKSHKVFHAPWLIYPIKYLPDNNVYSHISVCVKA